MQTKIHDISERLQSAESEEQVKSICEEFCKEIGFEYYIFAICSITSLSAPQVNCISNYPSEWFEVYFKEGMQKHDPIVKYCFDHPTPIRWDQILSMEKYIDADSQEVMRRASEYGLKNGLSIPLKSPTGAVSIFSLASSSSESIDGRLLVALTYGQLFSSRLFEVVAQLNINESDVNGFKLTARETECLFWACEGKTTWEISKIVDVTERTIIFHLTSATKKLGAVNRQHAVAKAIISGLIKPTP